MSDSTLTIFDVNPSTWVFRTPKPNPKGGFYGNVNNGDSYTSMAFQAAEFGEHPNLDVHPSIPSAIFGISDAHESAADPSRRQIALSFPTARQLEIYSAIDARCVEEAVKNAEVWFPGKYKSIETKIQAFIQERLDEEGVRPTQQEIDRERVREIKTRREVIMAAYKPLVIKSTKVDKDGNLYQPFLNAKIDIEDKLTPDGKEARKAAEVFTYNKAVGGFEPGTIADITKGVKVVPFVEVSGMWFTSAGFGLSLVVRKIAVFPRNGGRSYQPGLSAFKFPVNMPEEAKTPHPSTHHGQDYDIDPHTELGLSNMETDGDH